MKRTLVALFGSLMILSACSGGQETADEETAEETTGSESEETAEEGGEESKNPGDSNMTAADLISGAIENSQDVKSYEARQTFDMTGPELDSTVQTIMTYGEQDEFKLSVNNDGNILTHYVVDGGHFIYADNQISETDGTLEVEGSDYQTVVAGLENYPEGEIAALEEGYSLTVPIEDQADLEGVLDEAAAAAVESADSITGTLQLYFKGDNTFTGSELEATVTSADGEYTVHSTVDYTNIGNIDVIEKPHNMSDGE